MTFADMFSKLRLKRDKESESSDQGLPDHQVLILKASPSLRIKANTDRVDNLILTIEGKNLYNGEYDKGYLKYGDENLYDTNSEIHRTTMWFPVLANQGHSLVLSGTAHNRSVWQFQTADGTILTEVGVTQRYKTISDVMQDKTVSKIDIPENAVYARVYYAHLEDSTLENRMQIEYGRVPTHYQPYQSEQISIPTLREGDLVLYEKGVWLHCTDNKKMKLELSTPELLPGDVVSVNLETGSFEVIYEEEGKDIIYTGTYGVRWNLKDSNPVCERIGDAKGLTFNAIHNSSYLTPYENSFDNIYPWSDLKLCNVKVTKNQNYKVIYSDEDGFSLEGSAGNVMVEIPKFYCKREIIDNYEYLWISASEQDGFTLDPSFITTNGIVDHIYIGAYLSKISKERLFSVSNSFPVIKKSLKEIKELTLNSNGIQECDLLTILTIQRLFLVETAILDSQSLFTGNVHLPYLLKDKNSSLYAVKSETATNRIFVKDTKVTRRFRIGDAVSVLSSWKEYKNKPLSFQREITKINDLGDETLEIEFSGDPIDITRQETGITCIPCKNGITDEIPYVTGALGDLTGHISFKYRGIENLWGNVWIFLDNAIVKDSILHITYPNGETIKLDYKVPVQNVELFPAKFGDPVNMIVKRMGYDLTNPLIMFPSEIGNGATTSTYYCDAWYNLAEEGFSYVLTYGGAWDNKGYAGIFNYRASFSDTDKIPYNGSRIMLRPSVGKH